MQLQRHIRNTDFAWRDAVGPFRRVSEAQARQWNTDGGFLLEQVIPQATLDALIAAIDPLEAKTNAFLRTVKDKRQYIARADEVTFALHVVRQAAVAREFASSALFADLCSDLLGPDCRLYWDQAVYKKPWCPEEFPWHQDNGYNYVAPQDYLTCWVPLVDTTIDNGCPWVMPRVHRSGTLQHWHTDLGYECLHDAQGAVAIEARAGDVVVFSSLTPHRTGPNVTAAERKAYILQFAHADAVMLAKEGDETSPQDDPERQFLVLKDGVPLA
jgi:phytanoyl-CoA hydroxylase